MSSREEILNNIKKNIPSTSIELPQTNIAHTRYENKNENLQLR